MEKIVDNTKLIAVLTEIRDALIREEEISVAALLKEKGFFLYKDAVMMYINKNTQCIDDDLCRSIREEHNRIVHEKRAAKKRELAEKATFRYLLRSQTEKDSQGTNHASS